MGAFDTAQKTIRDEGWDAGEEVVIRELTYGEQIEIDKISLSGLTLEQTKDKTRREQVTFGSLATDKQALAKMQACIVSWTFEQGGKTLPINAKTIMSLRSSYGAYIAAQIEELNPTRDEDFQDESGSGAVGEEQAT